jgi:4-hydroxy-tetrahydrodipicolinate synthase
VTANVAPALCAAFQTSWKNKDLETFHALQSRLAPLHKALFVETSPAPVKYAASRLGLCRDEVRLPLVPASESARRAVDSALADAGLIENVRPDKLRHHG